MRLRDADLSWREIDGELILLDLRSSTYLASNASGSVLIKHLVEDRTMGELAQALVDAFGIPPAQARNDAEDFLAELERSGMLEGS
ncbi:MAG: PqqD family protein [Propionibacteriaceae bacterium]|jgi:hypothetical protein|nr:PqqD family protein [Propionibacteriaceae bacterium]